VQRISPRVHVVVDALAVVATALAPTVLWFGGRPASIAYALAGACLLLMMLTDYPGGAVRIIPFPFHGAIEVLAGIVVLIMPWLAGFADEPAARNYFIGLALVMIAVVPVTDYAAGEEFELPF
jgi:hypothetical protein